MEEVSTRRARRRRGAPIEIFDDQQQESLIEKFVSQAESQSKLYRLVFSIVLVLPTPTYIFAKHCRKNPKLSFLSLVSLMASVYSLRRTAKSLKSLQKLNIVLATVIGTQAWLRFSESWGMADSVWLFPLLAAATAMLLDHWMTEVQLEISRLQRKKYDLSGA